MALVKYNNNSISSITTAGQLASGSLVPISEQTASGSSSISFTTGIESTYPIYQFEFINIHPQNNNIDFEFNFSSDGGSNYNVTKTTTLFKTFHDEADTSTILEYDDGRDIAQGTGYQDIATNFGNDNDQNLAGTLEIFNPSSTTFVKHFICRTQFTHHADFTVEHYVAGYGNTTSAITNIKFQMSSGNIDDGIIKMYGVA